MADLKDYIRTIPDFPVPGIQFRDVTTLFAHRDGFRLMLDQLVEAIGDLEIDCIAGIEARGFVLGGALADRLGTGFVPIRKKGKLPGKTIEESYQLEYGEAVVELHEDALSKGERVVLIDDLLATGGTAAAGLRLIDRLGATTVACVFVIDLPDLGGRKLLEELGQSVRCLVAYEGE
ncbi:adenine phosphoribosyltransferase [Pseudoroseicyclus aestuarii]|uniref:Adenine phosphoribosyltransferase n=1 Tax=Pseudoroseicyclus aestuarii TaxID=1795041 RepID=A0A318T414_9RHOB|nr:adenine phosphoribosyltransferase [Pseudoroseicyclus aestuarii]PYE85004.1 adenine phosphoribosyltransferase [Pseudoroseicyclus aestuarii]